MSNGDHFWNYELGASYYEEITPVVVTGDQNTAVTDIPFFVSFPNYIVNPGSVEVDVPGSSHVASVFGSSRFRFTSKLGLELGVRYTDQYQNSQQSYLTVRDAGGAPVCVTASEPPPCVRLPFLPGDDSSRTHAFFTGGANLTYKVDNDISTYLSWGHSFRPGVAAVGATTPISPNVLLANSETSDSFELGLKGYFFERRLSANVDIFHQNFYGYIGHTADSISADLPGSTSPSPTASGLALNFNGNVSSTGVEASFIAHPIGAWTVGLDLSYVDAHYVNANEPCNTPDPAHPGQLIYNTPADGVSYCTTNGRVAETPDFHLSANTEYDFDSIGDIKPYVRGLLTYQPGFYSTVAHYNYSDLTLVNLYAGLRSDKGWELTAFVKNLFDQQVITNINDVNGTITPFSVTGVQGEVYNSGYKTATVSVPREIGVTASYRF